MNSADITTRAFAIADQAVVSDIETNGISLAVKTGHPRRYDVRPMLDPREQPPECIDMAQQAIDYALARGLVLRTADEGVLAVVGVAGGGLHTPAA